MTDGKLDKVYDLNSPEAVRDYYDDWAADYDRELEASGYATPARCAAALKSVGLPSQAGILDMGCGTGLSGMALAREGYSVIDGMDVSEGMLAEAQKRNCYGALMTPGQTEIGTGAYDAVVAAGVIGPGAAEPWLFDHCLDLLAPGGLFCFSFNDHAQDIPAYTEKLAAALADGRARTIYEDYGDHIPTLDVKSTVYVLERQ